MEFALKSMLLKAGSDLSIFKPVKTVIGIATTVFSFVYLLLLLLLLGSTAVYCGQHLSTFVHVCVYAYPSSILLCSPCVPARYAVRDIWRN